MKTRVLSRWMLALGAASLCCACGGSENPVTAKLKVPEPREARIALTPALDLSGLIDDTLAERIAIEEISVNLTDVRLLGADPRIPVGGLRLLQEERLLVTHGEAVAAAEFPFSETLVDDSLAVFLRLGTTAALEGASVVVKARLYKMPFRRSAASLTSDHEGADEDAPIKPIAPDPDGDPAAPDPDGDPAIFGHRRCAPDPDGDPAHCLQKHALTTFTGIGRSVPFELHGSDLVDLVVGFDKGSRLDVILGIPAARWFTEEAVKTLEDALDAGANEPTGTEPGSPDKVEHKTILGLEGKRNMSDMHSSGDSQDDYRLLEEQQVDPRNIRNR